MFYDVFVCFLCCCFGVVILRGCLFVLVFFLCCRFVVVLLALFICCCYCLFDVR